MHLQPDGLGNFVQVRDENRFHDGYAEPKPPIPLSLILRTALLIVLPVGGMLALMAFLPGSSG